MYVNLYLTGSETGSEEEGSETEEGSEEEGSTSEEEDALEKLQKRFGVAPTKKQPVKVSCLVHYLHSISYGGYLTFGNASLM